MSLIKSLFTGKIRLPFFNYKMKKKDKKLFFESLILTLIYLLSFAILSLGRVRQEFFGISEATFSNLQLMILTFIFAVVITWIVYSLYKKVTL